MPFDDRIKGLVTPQRVLALCKLVDYGKFDKDDLKDLLEPAGVNKEQDKFKEIFSFASRGRLITEDVDGKISLIMDKEEISSPDAFRRGIVKRVFANPELIFTRFTSWYLARGKKVYSEKKTDLAASFDTEINLARDLNIYNDTNVTAWQVWASYLGFGFQHLLGRSNVLIPNVAVRLADVLSEDGELKRGEAIPFFQFMNWLNKVCPELDLGELFKNNLGKAQIKEQALTVGLSAGLRSIHNQGKIKLSYVQDASDVWYLTRVINHEITDKVSHIVVERW